MRKSQRLATAYHAAGHVVIAWRRGLKVKSATIVPDDESHGRVSHASALRGINLGFDGSDRARLRAETAMVVSLAGPIAQRRYSPR